MSEKEVKFNEDHAIAELEQKVAEYHALFLKSQGALEVLLQIKRIKENEDKKSDGKNRANK